MTQTKLAIIINSPSYDRVSYALSIAAMSAAQFNEVHVLFTYGAVLRLVKGRVNVVSDETEAWIRKDVERGLENGTIKKISELISFLQGFGGKIYACVAAMQFHNITKDDLIDVIDERIGISTFLLKTEGAAITYV